MKIYFAGSIRGGRADAELYHGLIEFMKEKHTVLTEHIGSPALFELEKGQSDEEIYLQDTNWLRESDLVIAECSCPSLGVGYELAYAEKLGKPVYIFHRAEVSLSAMLQGDAYFHCFAYKTEEELFVLVKKII